MSSPAHLEQEKAGDTDQERMTSSSPTESLEKHDKTIAPRPTKAKWILVCVGLFLGALLYGLDTTIAADVQASVYNDLGDIENLPWVGVGFPMGSVAVILLVGRVFATFEIKRLIIGFILLFEIGSAICGAAPTSSALIIGRVIAGIGGSGMFIGALTYVSVFATLREQPLYNALLGLSWGIGAILGPVVGGAFSDSSASWRWAFYINLPLAGLLSPVYFFVFPQYNPLPTMAFWNKFKGLDWAGACLNAATFVLFMVALTLSGPTLPWSSGGAIVLWVVFGISIITYALQQIFCIFTTPERRLFPVHFAKRRTYLLIYFATASVATSSAICIYFIPIYFQFTKGDSAIDAAVRLLPFIILYVAAIMFSGALLPVFSRYVVWYAPAGVLITIGGALMYRVDESTSTASIYGYQVLIAIGSGLIFQTGYAVLSAKSEPKDVAASIGFVNVSQIGSVAIALSIAGNVFQNVGYAKLHAALAPYGFPESYLRDALAGAQSALPSQGYSKVEGLAIHAIVDTISQLYILVIAAGALTIVSAALMRWEKLNLTPGGSA